MPNASVLEFLTSKLGEMCVAKGAKAPVSADSALFGGELPIDSLDLATVVVELQMHTNRDPFAKGFVSFTTVGELAALFAAE